MPIPPLFTIPGQMTAAAIKQALTQLATALRESRVETQATNATPTAAPTLGRTIYDTTSKKLWIGDGSAWRYTTLT